MATQTTGLAGLADRYAVALYELAEESHAIDAIAADLKTIRAVVAESHDFRRVIDSPVLSRAEQSKGVLAVLAAVGVSDLARRFVGVLAANRRLFVLPRVIARYLERVAQARGEEVARVTTAVPLSAAQSQALADALGRALGPKLTIDLSVDEKLIGGMVVQVRSKLVDSSINTKLRRLSLAMNGAA